MREPRRATARNKQHADVELESTYTWITVKSYRIIKKGFGFLIQLESNSCYRNRLTSICDIYGSCQNICISQ